MLSELFTWGSIALSNLLSREAAISQPRAASKPNILVILSDDQDNHMSQIQYMPLLQQYIIDKGATHPKHYCTVSQCCPSRASLWTGKHAHNHNVTDVNGAYGMSSIQSTWACQYAVKMLNLS
jgi:N-acetylglucosamine-6-sulfatase